MYKELNQNVLGIIGFAYDSRSVKDFVFVSVFIGVFYKDMKNIYKDLTGIDPFQYLQPTVSTSLGYLMDKNNGFKECPFKKGAENVEVYKQLKEDIIKYGLPFMEKLKVIQKIMLSHTI